VGLQQIGRENQSLAFQTFDRLCKTFAKPRYYHGLPDNARALYVAGSHFCRGVFGTFRDDGRAALDSADALDASGLKLYAMIASALRYLYYVNRGELNKAQGFREQVEIHAAEVGSAWQVELWEAPALIPISSILSDVVGMARIRDRLAIAQHQVPSLALYTRLASASLLLVRRGENLIEEGLAITKDITDKMPPRAFIGWAALHGFLARGFNEQQEFERAKDMCERALRFLNPGDTEYVTLFLTLEIQSAVAEAGLGRVDEALAMLDKLLKRHGGSDHPLVHGGIHEARAQICFAANRAEEFAFSLAKTEQWYRPTGTPALIAKCERLAELANSPRSRDGRPGSDSTSTRLPRAKLREELASAALSVADPESGPGKVLQESERAAQTVALPRPGRSRNTAE
jgi:tetratricopeptide (TPR) repeat protein